MKRFLSFLIIFLFIGMFIISSLAGELEIRKGVVYSTSTVSIVEIFGYPPPIFTEEVVYPTVDMSFYPPPSTSTPHPIPTQPPSY